MKALKGMIDRMFVDMKKQEYISKVASLVAKRYNFEKIITPILEETSLFKRSVGDETDVASKEMYEFIDKGGRSVCLRPEGTSSIVRAYLEKTLYKSNPNVKWYYDGPMYRYEAPQKGRMREFYQIGFESFGIRSPLLDAELINISLDILKELNISDVVLEINTLGNKESRLKYISVLKEFLIKNIDKLSENSKIRVYKNPLRVLDSKEEIDQDLLKDFPSLHSFLDEESKVYFEELKSNLDLLNIKYIVNPKLVRGLDYYSDTVFEIKSDKLGSQSTLIGGGRYDKLTSILANVDIPAVGFAIGVERLLLLLDENSVNDEKINIFLIYQAETKNYMLKILNELRKKDFNVYFEYNIKSFSNQLKKANKLNCRFALLLGEDEKNKNMVTIKDLKKSEQEIIKLEELESRLNNV